MSADILVKAPDTPVRAIAPSTLFIDVTDAICYP